MRRFTVPAMLVAAAVALTFVSPAVAATTPTVDEIGSVAFDTTSNALVDVGYTCADDAPPFLDLTLTQPGGGRAETEVDAACDDEHQVVTVPLHNDGLVTGEANAQVTLGDQSVSQTVHVDVVPFAEISLVGTVPFSDPRHGEATFSYRCFQSAQVQVFAGGGTDSSQGTAPVACDGQPHTVTVPLVARALGYEVGTYFVGFTATIGEGGVPEARLDQDATLVVAAPAPVPVVTITLNASPETAVEGKKITVEGTIRRDGKRLAKAKVVLAFEADSGDGDDTYRVTASKKGDLKTTVQARTSGTFTFVYEDAESNGDHIVVREPLPKPKKYKNCTALNKVYKHGVGKMGCARPGRGRRQLHPGRQDLRQEQEVGPGQGRHRLREGIGPRPRRRPRWR